MDENFVLVKYLSKINTVVKQTFQSKQRIKFNCFHSSTNYLVFGATSGGIYIFRRDPCEFLKLIPSKEGSANIIAISKDERHIAVASSQGLMLIFENFIEDSSSQYQVFSQHESNNVTYIKWHKNELYVGDDKGKISVISALFQKKSIFQIPTATLMTLDSSIVQIDAYQCFLLISTKTKTYICNTEQERFVQIGKKLRDGSFGACFCNKHNDNDEISIPSTGSPYQSVESELLLLNSNYNNLNTKIYCARPGARLWEVSFDARVLVTYQFKSSLNEPASEVLIIGSEEEATLDTYKNDHQEVITDFNFQKIYSICDRFVLTYDSNRLYIFDPVSNKLVFWTIFSSGIVDVAFVNSNLYVWMDNLEISVLSVLQLETLILSTLYKKQFYLCMEICLKFQRNVLELLENSKKLYLLSALKNKINDSDLLEKLDPIFDKIKQTNEKVFKGPQKSTNSIVVVDNLYVNEPMQPKLLVDKENDELKLILKQYNLNKTHKTIDIPEVTKLLETYNGEQLFLLLKKFSEYVTKELNEDSSSWCQQQYLKQISNRNISVKDLNNESFNYLTEAVIKANELINFSCPCGYPLPKCHKNAPNFYKTALDVFNSKKTTNDLLKSIPYLWRYKIKTEIYGLNMTALIQYSHLGLFKEHTVALTYDNWHDILGYFVKINKSLCLNCDRKINIESLLTWTEIAKVIVQYLGSKNAIRILGKYEKFIPNSALDVSFYQVCIFAHSFSNNDNISKLNKEVPFLKFYEELDKDGSKKFQESMVKYFKRKYATNTPYYAFSPAKSGSCGLCNLPLKNDILYDCEALKCGHKFHKFCIDRSEKTCPICN